MVSKRERVRVAPETVTVLGDKVKPTDPEWTGLDLANAEPRTQASLMLAVVGQDEAPTDIHLCVPWVHPEDAARGMGPDGVRYRVRPRMEAGRKWKGKVVKSVAFERWDGDWMIAIEYA